ncbi:MAG: glycosyltransferase [Alphaproteobacteria bacterium]
MSESAPDLTILVPVYNEAGNIGPLTQEIHEVIGEAIHFELVFVNDGSTDGSAGELAEAKRRYQDVRVVGHSRRSGKSAALWTGKRVSRGRWIQTLDGDRQNDPADVLTLWRHLHEAGLPDTRLGIVAGQRKRRNDGAFKWLQSRIANGMRSTLLKDGTRDTGCGFKLMRREAFDDVPFFDGMHRFLPALVRRAGWDVLQYPVNDRPRVEGTSKYGFLGRLGAGIYDLLGVIWLMRRGTFPPERTGDL